MTLVVFALLTAQASQGSVALDGKPSSVQSVCAFEEEDRFDRKKIRITAVVALTALSPEAKKSCKAAAEAVRRDDGASALIATISSPELSWYYATVHVQGKSFSYSPGGSDPNLVFEPEPGSTATGEKLAGRLRTYGGLKVDGWPTLSVDVPVLVPLEKIPAQPPAITGAEALRHPATIAAKKFLTAMSQGNQARIRENILTDERLLFDERMKSPEKATAMPMLKKMAADALLLPTASVRIRGDTAEVVLERADPKGTNRESASFKLRLEQGVWRITQDR
jgi:hypothetical protein